MTLRTLNPNDIGHGNSSVSDNLSKFSVLGSLVDHTNLDGSRGVVVADNYAYVVAYDSDRVTICDVAGDSPAVVSSVLLTGTHPAPRSVAVAGNICAVVTSLGNDLVLISVKDKSNPTILATLHDATHLKGAVRVQIVGRYAYTTGTDYFAIWDISRPASPALVGSVAITAENLFGFTIKGDTAFVAASATDKYYAIDITTKTAPAIISSVTITGSGPHWITVDGKYGYTANSGTDSVHIIDVSNPAAMTVVGSISDPTRLNGAHTLVKLGKYLLVCAQSNSGFAVVDVTDPTAPVVIGSVTDNTIMDGVRSMAVTGTKCFGAAFTSDALAVLDLKGLVVATARIGSFRADEGSVRGDFMAGSLKAQDGIVAGPGGIESFGPAVFPALVVNGVTIDTNGGGGGGGSTTADSFDALVFGKAWSNTTFATFTQLSTRYNGGSRKGSGGQNDEVVFKLPIPLKGGTGTIELLHTATTDRGIYTITTSIDGTTYTALTTIDGYNASLTQTRTEVTGLTIPDGTQFIKLKMLTKNGSSSNYNSEISGLYGLRTGA